MFFLKSSKFQHNIKISIKTAQVSGLSVSHDYGANDDKRILKPDGVITCHYGVITCPYP